MSGNKREGSLGSFGPLKRQKLKKNGEISGSSTPSLQNAIALARARLEAKKGITASSVETEPILKTTVVKKPIAPSKPKIGHEETGKGGLNIEIHPLLRNVGKRPELKFDPMTNGSRRWFDPTSVNPYLNQEDVTLANKPKKTGLNFNEQGKYVSKAEELRESLKLEKIRAEKLELTRRLGLEPDEAIGEGLYKPQNPPLVEWWDKPYLHDRVYDFIEDETRLNYENENAFISDLIHVPVIVKAPWEKHLPMEDKAYLTKKEMKRLRRNTRLEKNKEKQDRIRLGLDPAPAPKVRLSNLMSVMTNEAIKDPTAMEAKVKQEVEDRRLTHEAENAARKLTSDQRHEKERKRIEENISKGYFTAVFKIDRLVNPQHRYKIDINAKQLELTGVTMVGPSFSLVVIEGGEKTVQFYKKLMLNRIKWTENAAPKQKEGQPPFDGKLEDLSNNKCKLIWEGQVKEFNFKKWSISEAEDQEKALEILSKYHADHYWREAIVES